MPAQGVLIGRLTNGCCLLPFGKPVFCWSGRKARLLFVQWLVYDVIRAIFEPL